MHNMGVSAFPPLSVWAVCRCTVLQPKQSVQFIPLLALWQIWGENTTAVPNLQGFPGGSVVKNPPANAEEAGDADSIPGLGRSPGGGHSNPLGCSCLENPMDRGDWWATVHRVSKNQIQLVTEHTHTHAHTHTRTWGHTHRINVH